MAQKPKPVKLQSSTSGQPIMQTPHEEPQQKKMSFLRSKESFMPNPYLMPELKYLGKTLAETEKPLTLCASNIWKMDHLDNPIILYGHPYSGKTCIFKKMMAEAREMYGKNHWIRCVNLTGMGRMSSEKRPKSFIALCAIYMKVTEKSLKEIFKPLAKVKDILRRGDLSQLVKGELFLDGFDEMARCDRDYFLHLFSQTVSKRKDCPIRIWMNCRTHLKPKLTGIVGDSSSFEILCYSQEKQMEMLRSRWKDQAPKSSNGECKLTRFVNFSYSALQREFKDFASTLGAVPLIMDAISGMLAEMADIYMNTEEEALASLGTPYSGFTTPTLLENLVYTMVEYYYYKMGRSVNSLELNGEYQQVIQIHTKFAAQIFPYEYLHDMTENKDPLTKVISVDDDILYLGFLLYDNGVIRFHHKTLGDFFIGRFFASANSLDERDPWIDRFFTRVLLIEPAAKGIRKYMDASLYLDDKVEFNTGILEDFLIMHYNLRENEKADWEITKDKGNIWHVSVMEGLHKIAEIILRCFSNDKKQELRQFLRMTAPIEFFQGRHLSGQLDCGKEHHNVSSLSMLALFGYGDQIRNLIEIILSTFDEEEIKKEFHKQDHWTPMHYACVHCNLWFIGNIHRKVKFNINASIFNTNGLLPQHCLMYYALHSFYHVLILKDPIYPEFDFLPPVIAHVKDDRDFRKIVCLQDMVKDFSGKMNLFRAAHHYCLVYLVSAEDINTGDKNGMTLLHYSARDGFNEIVKHLVDHGGDVAALDKDGRTPLHLAALHGHRDIFLYLVKKRARPVQRDYHGFSPIALWRRWGEKCDQALSMSPHEEYFFKACDDVEKVSEDQLRLTEQGNDKNTILGDKKEMKLKVDEDF